MRSAHDLSRHRPRRAESGAHQWSRRPAYFAPMASGLARRLIRAARGDGPWLTLPNPIPGLRVSGSPAIQTRAKRSRSTAVVPVSTSLAALSCARPARSTRLWKSSSICESGILVTRAAAFSSISDGRTRRSPMLRLVLVGTTPRGLAIHERRAQRRRILIAPNWQVVDAQGGAAQPQARHRPGSVQAATRGPTDHSAD